MSLSSVGSSPSVFSNLKPVGSFLAPVLFSSLLPGIALVQKMLAMGTALFPHTLWIDEIDDPDGNDFLLTQAHVEPIASKMLKRSSALTGATLCSEQETEAQTRLTSLFTCGLERVEQLARSMNMGTPQVCLSLKPTPHPWTCKADRLSLQGSVIQIAIPIEQKRSSLSEAAKEFVLAHELQHIYHADVTARHALNALSSIINTACLGHLLLTQTWSLYNFSKLLPQMLLIETIGHLGLMYLSRYQERRADQEAINLLKNNAGAIEFLQCPDFVDDCYHPRAQERLAAAKAWKAKTD